MTVAPNPCVRSPAKLQTTSADPVVSNEGAADDGHQHGFCRTWCGIFFLPILTLAACSSKPENPSPESEFLQAELIPKLVRWGKSGSDILHLAEHLAARFDQVCTVFEYQSLSSLVQSEIPSAKEYHGKISDTVSENRIALVGVKGNVAHVAYLRSSSFTVYGREPCAVASKAVLRREKHRKRSTPTAVLEEAP